MTPPPAPPSTPLSTPLREAAAFGRFIAAPRRMPRRHAPGHGWVWRALGFAAAVLLVNIVLTLAVLGPLAGWAGVREGLPEHLNWRLVLLGGVFAPLAEELLMRAGLRRADYTLFVGPPLILFCLAPGGAWNVAAAVLAVALFVIWLVQRRGLRRAGGRVAAARRFVRHYPWVFWGYALGFALPHIGNYEWAGARGLAVVAMVLPQLLMGIVAGWLRLRDGLRASLLLHFANNAVALLMWDLMP